MIVLHSDYIIREKLQKIKDNYPRQEVQFHKILELYIELFPVSDGNLFRYSAFGNLGEGIISLVRSELIHIRNERDDIRHSLPLIFSAIQEQKAKYYEGMDFYLNQPSLKHTFPSRINAVVIVPITVGSIVIGYITSVIIEDGAILDEETLSSMTLFGQLVSHLIINSSTESASILSKRELEVMQRIAWGESLKEMAHTMNISEITVKQYVKQSVQKLGAINRTEAVVKLFRLGFIV